MASNMQHAVYTFRPRSGKKRCRLYWKEVVASLYAWDLLDEGLDHMLDVLQSETLTNCTYLVALMHDEKRPLTDFYYPHNPRRLVYWTEDSRARSEERRVGK